MEEFDCSLIDALCDVVPAVKPQSAYFEMLGWRGMETMEEVITHAKGKGLYVIADIKRGTSAPPPPPMPRRGWAHPGGEADCPGV